MSSMETSTSKDFKRYLNHLGLTVYTQYSQSNGEFAQVDSVGVSKTDFSYVANSARVGAKIVHLSFQDWHNSSITGGFFDKPREVWMEEVKPEVPDFTNDLSFLILNGAKFINAKLANAKFVGAELEGVDFTGADLRCADFTGCNLSGVNFSGADLEGANFTGADLTKARF